MHTRWLQACILQSDGGHRYGFRNNLLDLALIVKDHAVFPSSRNLSPSFRPSLRSTRKSLSRFCRWGSRPPTISSAAGSLS